MMFLRWLAGIGLMIGAGSALAEKLPDLGGAQPDASSRSPVSLMQNIGTKRSLPSLPEIFRRSAINDADLERQRYELEATRQETPMARAGLKPQISAGASYSYQHSDNYYTGNDSYDPDNPDNVGQDLSDYDARYRGKTHDRTWQVRLSQPLFSLEKWRRIDKAESQVDASKLQLAQAEQELALNVAKSYLDAYLASRKIGLLDSKAESLELQDRQARRSFELGVGDRINVLEASARLDQTRADKVAAENQLDNALSDLERFSGVLPDFSGYILGDLDDVKVDALVDSDDKWQARIDENLKVRLARERLKIAQADRSVRSAGHYPELSMNLTYSDRDSNDPYRESRDGVATLQLDVPIYQGGYTVASVRQGDFTARANQSAVDNELNLARQEVRKRLRGLNGDSRQLEALSQSIASSRLFVEAAERGENVGLRDLVDVLDARADLYDLRIKFVEAIRAYLLDRLNLKAAVGSLTTEDMNDVMTLLTSITDESVNAESSE